MRLRVEVRASMHCTGTTFFFRGDRQGAGNETGADDRNDEEQGGQQVEESLGASVEYVRERSMDSTGNDPNQADDDANSADREKRCTDYNEHVAGHELPRRGMPLAAHSSPEQDLPTERDTPHRNLFTGEDYERIGSAGQVIEDTNQTQGSS